MLWQKEITWASWSLLISFACTDMHRAFFILSRFYLLSRWLTDFLISFIFIQSYFKVIHMCKSLSSDFGNSETSLQFPTLPFPTQHKWSLGHYSYKSSLFVALVCSSATLRSALTFHTGFIKAICLNLCGSSTSVDNVSIFPDTLHFLKKLSEIDLFSTRKSGGTRKKCFEVFWLII